MAEKIIELTTEELEELKDTIKFRTKVYLQLKQLNNIPEKVTILKVWSKIHTWVIGIMVTGFFVLIGLVFYMGR